LADDQYKKAFTAKATIGDVVNLIHQAMDHHRKTYHPSVWARLTSRLRGKPKVAK
jgi:hypothetical protein